jgi:dolichol-phosphate mannosyltransferase
LNNFRGYPVDLEVVSGGFEESLPFSRSLAILGGAIQGMRPLPGISIVVPCFNEEAVIGECHTRLSGVLRTLGMIYEIVYVDDGSKDSTLRKLQSIYESDANVAVVELSRNFGHQTAVTAGLDVARGEAVVIFDADLQDPPELIAEMIEIWRQGYEVVYGVRDSREGESGFKVWTAKTFYRLINKMSDVEIPIDAGDFRLLDRAAVDAMKRMPERNRLLRGMCSWIGFRQYGLRYARAARFAGTTKYPLRKMIHLALDGIASFSTVPLRLLSVLGLISSALAIFGILYALIVRLFTHDWVPGWTITFIGILFVGGVQMISLGILGEYVGRIYDEAKQRPLYFARNVLHSRNEEASRLAGSGPYRSEAVVPLLRQFGDISSQK